MYKEASEWRITEEYIQNMIKKRESCLGIKSLGRSRGSWLWGTFEGMNRRGYWGCVGGSSNTH